MKQCLKKDVRLAIKVSHVCIYLCTRVRHVYLPEIESKTRLFASALKKRHVYLPRLLSKTHVCLPWLASKTYLPWLEHRTYLERYERRTVTWTRQKSYLITKIKHFRKKTTFTWSWKKDIRIFLSTQEGQLLEHEGKAIIWTREKKTCVHLGTKAERLPNHEKNSVHLVTKERRRNEIKT